MPSFEDIQAEIENVLSVDDGTLFEADSAMVDAYLEELASAEAGKIDAFCRYIRMKAAAADAKREEAGRLMESARSDENTINFLKMRYLMVMQRHGLQKISGSAYKVSVRSCDIVQITDEKALPQQYITEKVTTAPDKVALRDALKNGEAIPGAQLAKSYSLRVA